MFRRKPTPKKRIANQIFQDPWGFEARVKFQGKLYPQRFDPDTPLFTMQRWQLDAKEGLALGLAPVITPRATTNQRRRHNELIRIRRDRDRAATMAAIPAMDSPAGTGGTLAARLDAFFPQIAGRVSFKADRSHLRAWIHAKGADGVELGTKDPAAITAADLNVIIGAWRTAPPAGKPGQPLAVRRITVTAYDRDGKAVGTYDRKTPTTSSAQVVAVKTVRHRCRLLREFLVTEGLPVNAIDTAKIPAAEKSHPVGVPIDTITTVAQKLAKHPEWADTYGRYLVLNTTAQRPAQVMRALPDDVRLDAKLWIVRSAKGAPAHTITLNSDMIKAWRVFIAANAWGTYDTSRHAMRLRECGWPAAIRPYNARHSVVQDALQDYDVRLDDVQGLAGHAKAETTRAFYGPLAIDRQRHISNRLDGRMKAAFSPRLVKKKPTAR
jgi:integrase